MDKTIEELKAWISNVTIDINSAFTKRERADAQVEILRQLKGDMEGRLSELEFSEKPKL